MNDHFEVAYEEDQVSSDALVKAAHACLDDLLETCDDCLKELLTRDPVIITHCRDYMQRYAMSFCSRVNLELCHFFPPSGVPASADIPETTYLEMIFLLQRIETLRKYSFIPRSFYQRLRGNLLTHDQIVTLYIQRAVEENNAWCVSMLLLQPRYRGHRLSEYYAFIEDKIKRYQVVGKKMDSIFRSTLLRNVVDNMVLNLLRNIATFAFDEFGEEALRNHILGCQNCVRQLSQIRVSLRVEGQWQQQPLLSPSTLEYATDAFLNSAQRAAESAVSYCSSVFEDNVSLLLEERIPGWIGGKAIENYLSRINGWLDSFFLGIPKEYHFIVLREFIRYVIGVYLRKIMCKYTSNKKFRFSEEGVLQIASDLQAIQQWIISIDSACVPYGDTDTHISATVDMRMLLKFLRVFITSAENDLLLCFTEAIQHFGMASSLYLYDMLRLCLKLREDLKKKNRKYILGLCTEFIEKLSAATIERFGPLSSPPRRLSGPEVLAELFSKAGTYHCTGKKWSLTYLAEPELERMRIVELVTDACNVARLRHSAIPSSDAHMKDETALRRMYDCENGDDEAVKSSSRKPAGTIIDLNGASFVSLHEALRPPPECNIPPAPAIFLPKLRLSSMSELTHRARTFSVTEVTLPQAHFEEDNIPKPIPPAKPPKPKSFIGVPPNLAMLSEGLIPESAVISPTTATNTSDDTDIYSAFAKLLQQTQQALPDACRSNTNGQTM